MQFIIHWKEKFYFKILLVVSISLYALLLSFFSMYSISLIHSIATISMYAITIITFKYMLSLFFMGYIKGNAIQIHEHQFPDIFELAKAHVNKLQMGMPEIYVLQGNGFLNAFAARLAHRNVVVLYSGILEMAYQDGIDVLSFILGHELGHIKRKHIGSILSFLIWPAKQLPFLASAYARACEYTSDNIGYWLSPTGAIPGILVLAAGQKLFRKINIDQLPEKLHFSANLAEIFSSHPILMKRISSIKNQPQNPISNRHAATTVEYMPAEKQKEYFQ